MTEQINEFVSSGLYDKIRTLWICTSSPIVNGTLLNDSSGAVRHFFDESYPNLTKIVYLHHSDERTYENASMNAIVDKSSALVETEGDAFILYLHNKGSFRAKQSSEMWRRTMMHYVVTQWNGCVQLLDEGYLTAGPFYNWLSKYYSGNFWWARASFLTNKTKIDIHGHRGLAESFLLNQKPINAKQHANLKGLSIFNHLNENFSY